MLGHPSSLHPSFFRRTGTIDEQIGDHVTWQTVGWDKQSASQQSTQWTAVAGVRWVLGFAVLTLTYDAFGGLARSMSKMEIN
jgi:hypothetical protein